jgi:two-component system aerobic respiration control sensor histidine kinase ArcB
MNENRIGIVACASMHEQIKECVESMEGSFKIYPLIPPCTFNLKIGLIKYYLDKSISENNVTVLAYGLCHPQILTLQEEYGNKIIRLEGNNCYEIFLGKDKYAEYHRKCYWMLNKPFFTKYRKDLLAGYELNTKNGRTLMDENFKKLIYLDFENDPLDISIIEDFARSVYLDFEIYSANIKNLKRVLVDALASATPIIPEIVSEAPLDYPDKSEVSIILEHIGEIIYKIDVHSRKFSYISPQVKSILGYTPIEFKDIINDEVQVSLYHDDDREIILAKRYNFLIRCLNEGFRDPYKEIFRIRHKNGKILWVLESMYPSYNSKGEIESFIGKIEDITKRIEVEQELKESGEKYREAYELVNFYKDLITHNMNNILQTIISTIEIYSKFQNDPINLNKLGNLSEIIDRHAWRGANLITNVNKLSILNQKELKLRDTQISKILNKSIENTIASFQGRSVDIGIDGLSKEMKVLGNELLIDIFDNILNNAVKYSETKGDIKVDIKVSKIREYGINYVKFEFLDYGVGVPDEKKEILFQKLHSKILKRGGMGIGLSLVKKIVDGFGGKIWVEDRVKGDHKKGSNFIVLLRET